MNGEVRQRLLGEAAVRAAAHPADLEAAVGAGMLAVRRKFVLGGVVAVAVALALTAAFVAWRIAVIPPPPPTLESIAVTSASQAQNSQTAKPVSLRPAATLALTATGRYSDGSTRRLREGVEWSSSNPAVATVDGAGVVTAVAAGNAELTATLTGVSGSLALAVLGPDGAELTGLHVSPESASVEPGKAIQLIAEGTFSDGSRGNLNASAQWSSSDPGVVTVDGNGLATAVAPGTATVSASQEKLQGNAAITVPAAPKPTVTAVSVNPAQLSLKEGQTARLEAVATYSDGSSAVVGNAAWEIPPAGAATADVDPSGVVTARRAGSTVVVASLPGADGQPLRGQAQLTVLPSVKSITVSPAGPLQPEPGGSVQLRAVVSYSDGTTGTDVEWASSRPLIASVDASGLVTGVKEGDAEITATADGVTGNPVTVFVRTSPD
jgi:uncharacterized protein YjdB